jgi:hypothetical protein
MARLVHPQQHLYPTIHITRPDDLGRFFFLAMQFAVLGAMGLYLALAIANTLLGTPDATPAYHPYE